MAVCLLYRLVSERGDRFTATMAVLALCCFPSAVLFQLAYSEALAVLLIVTAVWFLRRHQYVCVLVAGILLSLTRPLGVTHGVGRGHARTHALARGITHNISRRVNDGW